MTVCGSLVFFGKNGSRVPYPLAYGKISIGSSTDHHIRIRSDLDISCVMDTNELGVTILANDNENENIVINDVPSKKYTIMNDGDIIQLRTIKLKYLHPSLDQEHLKKTQKVLTERLNSSKNVEAKSKKIGNHLAVLERIPNVNSNKQRFSTGSEFVELKNTYKKNNKTSTPRSLFKTRSSQRIIAINNNSLTTLKENEEIDDNLIISTSPKPKRRSSFSIVQKSPVAKKNKTFSGNSNFSTPLPSKNKTYSGNVSDLSDNVTTPDNNVSAASITPLNVSKKKRNSLNRSSRFSYVDFPNSSTPKSAIKINKSSSIYKPLVEDITPASPLSRTSLRCSSLKKPAFTQRRSVNFNISSASENSSGQAFLLAQEDEEAVKPSPSGRKRKRNESVTSDRCLKKLKQDSTLDVDGDHDHSLQDSSVSGIHDLSDISLRSSNNESLSSKYTLRTPKIQKSPENDLTNIIGVKKLLQTPKVQKSPKNDLTNITGVKQILKTPKVQKSPKNDLTEVFGVKKLLKTPKTQKSPKNDLTKVIGVRKLLKTPKTKKSPKNDLTEVKGVKKLLRTPKAQKSPKNDLTEVFGVKKLLKSPKIQKSPKNDLTNVNGLKQLLKTPKSQKSPLNDLTRVGGVKKLMSSPKFQKSPRNDLMDVAGVKRLMSTPKEQKSPKNDLTNVVGLKKLMTSPKQQRMPNNDLSDIKGLKQIFISPRVQEEPHNDLIDVQGIKQLLRTPKKKSPNDSHDLSGIDILFNEPEESNFDKLLGKKPIRTYEKSPKSNQKENGSESSEHVLKWLEDQSKYNSELDQKPIKRGRKMKTNEAPEDLSSVSPKAENLNDTGRTRTRRGRRNKENSPDVKKSSPIKTRRMKKQIEEKETKPVTSTEQIEIDKTTQNLGNKVTRKTKNKDDIEEVPAKKKKENKKSNTEEVTRSTRSNKGKSKKYNEDEWDTPVKKDSKKLVTFNENVELLQTPLENVTKNVRNLRSRRVKLE